MSHLLGWDFQKRAAVHYYSTTSDLRELYHNLHAINQFFLSCTLPFVGVASNSHLLLYTLSHIKPSGNAPVRPGYNELTLQLATAACHVQRPNRNYLTKTGIGLQNYKVVHMRGM